MKPSRKNGSFGREDHVFSAYGGKTASYKDISTDAAYALIGSETNEDMVLFMGNGTSLTAFAYSLTTPEKGNVVMEKKGGMTYLHNDVPVTLFFEGKEMEFEPGELRKISLTN